MARAKLLQVLEANIGGARKHVLQLLHGLDRERFELHLACSVERDPGSAAPLEELRAQGIGVTTIAMRRRPSPVADLLALRRLVRLMRVERFDIVHTHASKAGFLGRFAARRAGVPVICHTPHTFPFQRVDTLLVWLYRWLERRAACWADRLVLVAPSQRRVALDARLCGEDRLAVVENGIALPADEPERLRRRYRLELGLHDETPAAGFVGRLTPQKDIQAFLDAASDLLRAGIGARIFLVGRADNLGYLRSLRPPIGPEAWQVVAEERQPPAGVRWSPELPVELLGQRQDAGALVAAFDVVMLPSRYEGLPYSLLEAMACGVPVVASDVTGNRDAIIQEQCGLLVSAGDARGFARATLRLLADAHLRRRLAAAARERVATTFTEERFLRRMTELYNVLLKEKGIASGG